MSEQEKSRLMNGYFFKVWWLDAILFLFWYFLVHIHFITFVQYIHPSPLAEVPLYLLIASQLGGKNFPGLPS
jgi:hypothetical protein